MPVINSDKDIKNQSGNILFLILIAVALFAALSYAVTQTSQTGGGGTDNESGKIHAAQLNQYPSLVRAQILRMRAKNIELSDLEFNPPSQFGSLSDPELGVFHPTGGTTYITAAPALMDNEQQGQWYYNMHFEIDNISSTENGSLRGNEVMAFLPDVKENICRRVNELNNLNTIPTVNNSAYYDNAKEFMDDTYVLPSSETIIGATNLTEFSGQTNGCYLENNNNKYVYFYALIER